MGFARTSNAAVRHFGLSWRVKGSYGVGGIFACIPSVFSKYPQKHPHLIQAVARINWTFKDKESCIRRHFRGEKEKSQTSLEGAGFLNGADYRIRTDDLPLTRRLLYQLS